MVLLSLVIAIVNGILVSVQSPTNAALSFKVGHTQATVISFAGGMIILFIVALFSGHLPLLANAAGLPAWQFLGGLYGAFLIYIITYCAPHLGIALTLTIIMLGQLSMGVVVDIFGLFQTEVVSVSFTRVLGILVVAVGLVLVYVSKRRDAAGGEGGSGSGSTGSAGKKPISKKALFFAFLAFLSGVGTAIQAPSNSALSESVGFIDASLVNFTVGFLISLIACLFAKKGHFNSMRGRGIKPWMILGGLYGAIGVFCNTVAVTYLGVVLLMAALMFGQLAMAVVIDATGILLSPKVKTDKYRVVGIICIAAGVALVTIARLWL